jgi:tetratricopeptide (TPR) repeat protein
MATESAREYFKFAKFSFDSKDYQKALDFINRAIDLEPDYTNGLILRAEINQHLGNYQEVIPDANQIIGVENQAISVFANTYLIRGLAYFHLEKFDQASADFRSSVSHNPENAEAYFYLGLISHQKASFFPALENFDKAIEKDGSNFEYYYHRAKTKIENYHPIPNTPTYDNIIADINKSISLNPEDYRAYELRCDMLKLSAAEIRAPYIDELTKIIKLFPDQPEFYAQRGIANILDYNFKGALEDLNKAIAFNGKNELTLRNRGLCFHNLGGYRDAISDYSSSIDLMIARYQDSQDKSLRRMLAETIVMRGRTYEQMGNPDDACTDFYNSAKLGSKTGLNNYRRSCNVFN